MPLDSCWHWHLSGENDNHNNNNNNYTNNWSNNKMVKVDVYSHLAMKNEKKSITDYDYNHSIKISIRDYWNNIEDYWIVRFASKCCKNKNKIIVSRYDRPIKWHWKC